MLSPCVAIAALAVCFTIRAPSALSEDGDRAKTDMVRISVLSLFHPKELVITPGPGSAVEMIAGNERLSFSRGDDARVILDGVHLTISTSRGMSTLRVDALSTVRAGWFLLEVPGKLRRRYFGSLAMRPHGTSLESVVTMPIETAVASIVAAESPPGAPMEALKAQAVATRSFLVARQSGHIGFDFCDTTHCQFLRSPPDENSLATRATAATRGLVLTWHDAATAQDQPVAAMYARSCGGETRSLREVGVHTRGYPYYAVHCTYCQRHPEMWQRQLGTSTAPRTERDRLLFNRVHGWGAVPSLADSTSHTDVGSVRIEGRGIGHGIGLCQLGAADMARHGTSFDRILAHYYPDTKIRSLGGQLAPPIMP
jgi:stage II sporulation protein D